MIDTYNNRNQEQILNEINQKKNLDNLNNNDKTFNNKSNSLLKNTQVDFDFNSPSNYFNGQPITNGFCSFKINPTINNEFAYLNRNKLVNRRLAIKKQNDYSLGLVSISKNHVEKSTLKNNQKLLSDFALGIILFLKQN
jgi:hypothetical protein